MAKDWAWCASPPAMEDGREEREYLRWRKWYAGRVKDALVNPLTEIDLAIQFMERDIRDPELLEHITLAREGRDALREAMEQLREAAGMEELK